MFGRATARVLTGADVADHSALHPLCAMGTLCLSYTGMPHRRLLLALWFLLALPGGLAAVSSGRYSVDVWTTENDLPQNSVMAIAQTRDGYLWLGTLNGLVRFDGSRFTVFDENNTPGLKSSRIFRLFEDSQTNLWIGTEGGAILIADRNGRISTASIADGREDATTRLSSIVEDPFGTVWLYTAGGQLGRHQSNRVDVWNASFGVPSQFRGLAAEQSGLLWIGADNFTVAVPLPANATGLGIAHQATVAKLDFLLASRHGAHWRLANGRVQQYSGSELKRDYGPYPWKAGVLVSAACEDREGNLVVGTYGDPGDGVYWFDADGSARRIEGLSHNSVLSLAMDSTGALWVGTDGGGLNRVWRQVFRTLEPTEGATVQSVCSDRSGGLWIGFNGDRVDHWSGERVEQYFISNPPASLAVRAVYVDASTNVWVGTLGGGLFQLLNGKFEPVHAFNGTSNPWVSAIMQSRTGRLWVGTRGGLSYKDGENWRTFGVLDGLSTGAVQAIAEDADGNLWVGTAGGGLNRISNGRVTLFVKTNGLPANDVSALHADRSGVLWVGTSAGLARFAKGRWTSFTTREGLASNSIRYLNEDEHGALWIGSNAGLMRTSIQNLNDFAEGGTNSIFVRTYSRAEGLPSRECSRESQPATARTSDGKLWFATIKGVAGVDPANIAVNSNPPPVVLEAVLIDGQDQAAHLLRRPQPSSITVPAGRESIGISFVALNLSAPRNTRFRYRLVGHESGWTEGGGNHGSAQYSRVPPGDYTFRVQAANEDDVWNIRGASLSITVLPPFWQTWWFITLSTLVGLGLVGGVVAFVSTQRLQRQLATLRQQEALERERARIARDLHDQLGANLTQVALLGELAEADKELPKEVEAHARQISATARETTRSLDEIVWTVNPANDTLDSLVNYLCKYAQDYFALAGLKYRIEVPPDLPAVPISPDVRHDVFLAAREAINNVVKHAKATSAWLRLRLHPESFSIEIEDDGVGVPPGAHDKGRNGLRNMRSRMDQVGGTFELERPARGGTIVRLTAPVQPPGRAKT